MTNKQLHDSEAEGIQKSFQRELNLHGTVSDSACFKRHTTKQSSVNRVGVLARQNSLFRFRGLEHESILSCSDNHCRGRERS